MLVTPVIAVNVIPPVAPALLALNDRRSPNPSLTILLISLPIRPHFPSHLQPVLVQEPHAAPVETRNPL